MLSIFEKERVSRVSHALALVSIPGYMEGALCSAEKAAAEVVSRLHAPQKKLHRAKL